MTVKHYKVLFSIPSNPVVLRISSSQDETMMDDTETIQEN